ncbi:MAG: LytTR family transcriptional regulator [Clostridia bacterium]|nr:LytTR family transcriptional regulator [Clostridia bacterium]
MKCDVIINPDCEEKVVIYLQKPNAVAEEIRRLAQGRNTELLGYRAGEVIRLNPLEVCCIAVQEQKVYALVGEEKYLLKERLYQLEELLPDCFVKINQSCLGNVRQMERFDTSLAGTLKIRFQNGYVDYVSRRQLKTIKERIGIKK